MRCRARPYEGKEPYIFISYAHGSAAVVYPLIEQLVSDGYRVWYDEGLHPGDNWLEVIAEHLYRSTVCLAPITPAFCSSHNCRSEISLALNLGKNVISVIMENFELPLASQLLLGPSHMLKRHDYSSQAAFFRKLYTTPALSPCRGAKVSLEDNTVISGGDLTTVLLDPIAINPAGGVLVELDTGKILRLPPDGLSLGTGASISGDRLMSGSGKLLLDGRVLRRNERVRLGLRALLQVGDRLMVYFSSAEAGRVLAEGRLHMLRREGTEDFLLLTASQDQQLGRDYPLTRGALTEGSVSRSHARIRYNGSSFSIMDLNSTNGTFLNGIRLLVGTDHPLSPGDTLRMGDAFFRYEVLNLR